MLLLFGAAVFHNGGGESYIAAFSPELQSGVYLEEGDLPNSSELQSLDEKTTLKLPGWNLLPIPLRLTNMEMDGMATGKAIFLYK